MEGKSGNGPGLGSGGYFGWTATAGLALCLSAALLIPSIAAAQDNVVTYRGSTANANDIIKSFMGGSGAAAKKQPIKRAKFRGIRFTDPTPVAEPQQQEEIPAPPAQTEQAAAPAEPAAMEASADPQATAATSGCPVSGTAVALEIKFSVNSAVLEADAYRNLRQMAEAMNSEELKGCRFMVEGHTDASGNPNYNLKLSRLRAASVKNFLMSRDIPTQRLETVGKGSKEPLDGLDPYSADNRRVQFRVVGSSGG